jgi:DNA-binding MurR/RpiR family transcriptional regulator
MPSPDVAFAATALGQRLLAFAESPDAPAAARKAALELVRHPMPAASAGIQSLARRAGVSAASASRFARALGFASFGGLRSALAQALHEALQPGQEPIDRPVEKLRAGTGSAARARSALAESLRGTAGNVAATVGNLDAAELAALAKTLRAARRVYVMGFGLSASLATLLALQLEPYLPHVIDVAAAGGNELAAGRLMDAGPGDVLIAISLPRYSADALRLAKLARDRKTLLVALTDSSAAPLARLAQHRLIAPSQHPVLPSGLAPALAAIDALATAVLLATGRHVARAQRLTEVTAHYFAGKR